MSTTINGRRKKQLKACQTKQDRLGDSRNSTGRKEVIKNLAEKISAKKSYSSKVTEEKPKKDGKKKKGGK